MPSSEIVTAWALLIPVLVAAFIALRAEFQKAAVKVEQVHKLVNSQLAELTAERDQARAEKDALLHRIKELESAHGS